MRIVIAVVSKIKVFRVHEYEEQSGNLELSMDYYEHIRVKMCDSLCSFVRSANTNIESL